jgi:hypothetical protein
MNWTPHNEKDLKPCTASELFAGAVFWIRQDNGEFHKATIPKEGEYITNAYRRGIKKFSIEGKLWTRRDKPFKHFWD